MPSDTNPSLQAMTEALGKSLRTLPRKKRELAAKRLGKLGAGLDGFFDTYRELVIVSARLERRLEPDDPLRAEVHAALAAARQAWGSLLDRDGSPPAPSAPPAASAPPVPPAHSTALVAVRQSAAVPVRGSPGRRLPDEAALVRYVRHRREVHRWPDEAVLTRYLSKRRARGPRYPDEAVLTRWLRERRAQAS